MNRTDQLLAALEAQGKRITSQRVAVCQALAESRSHPAPLAVYEQVSRKHPGISKATVYNTIALLRELGEVIEVGLGQEHTHYEPDPRPHANLICLRCGRVIDVEEPLVASLSANLAARHDILVKAARMDIYGYCADCREGYDLNWRHRES